MFLRKDTYRIPDGLRERVQAVWQDTRYQGLVEADPECFLSPDCQVIGRVVLGWHSVVFRGAVLRGDSASIN
jgi:carbonic anhydrase/acetyltransferase-like protein (isoleucine patch superfamily)